jgi:hypothetical protein
VGTSDVPAAYFFAALLPIEGRSKISENDHFALF